MIFCIDFDNTCCFEEFPMLGKSVPNAINVLRKLSKNNNLILWTARTGKQLEDAENWFFKNNIKLSASNENVITKEYLELKRLYGECRKIVPDFYIDDKNFGCPLKKYRNKKTNKVYEVVDWFKIEEILKEKSIL